MSAYNITEYGARGDGRTNDAAAIQKAIDAAHDAGGGMVVVPGGGQFLIGTVTLKSNVHLHLEPGALLLGSDKREDYQQVQTKGEWRRGGHHNTSGMMLQAHNATNIAITGFGTIDQRGRLFMEGFQDEDGRYIRKWIGHPTGWRPRMFNFVGCRRLTFRDVVLKDAASWCLHLTGCDDVMIHGIRILNDLATPNCDGIDPDHCTNVRISDCHIEAGDDCIVVKATRGGADLGYRGSHNITVTNCTMISTSAALKVGTESHADFSNITFSNCVIRSSSRGLAMQLRDTGNMENILFSDMTIETRLFYERWWGQADPIYVTALPRRAEQEAIGRVRHVRFNNILCRGENGVFIAGHPFDPAKGGKPTIEDVRLSNVRVEVDKWSKWPGGLHDRRPLGGEFVGLSKHPTCGVYVEHAADVVLDGVDVRWGGGQDGKLPDYFSHALMAVNAPGLEHGGLSGQAAQEQVEAKVIR